MIESSCIDRNGVSNPSEITGQEIPDVRALIQKVFKEQKRVWSPTQETARGIDSTSSSDCDNTISGPSPKDRL